MGVGWASDVHRHSSGSSHDTARHELDSFYEARSMSEAVTQVASGRSRTLESEKWLQNDERDGVWLTDVRMGPQPAKENKNAGREKQGASKWVRGELADEAQESGT